MANIPGRTKINGNSDLKILELERKLTRLTDNLINLDKGVEKELAAGFLEKLEEFTI